MKKLHSSGESNTEVDDPLCHLVSVDPVKLELPYNNTIVFDARDSFDRLIQRFSQFYEIINAMLQLLRIPRLNNLFKFLKKKRPEPFLTARLRYFLKDDAYKDVDALTTQLLCPTKSQKIIKKAKADQNVRNFKS